MRGTMFALALAGTLAGAACGGGDSPSTTGGGGSGGDATGGGTPTASSTSTSSSTGGGSSAACQALTTSIQQAVDEARTNAGTLGASLSVETPACGNLTVVSGNSVPGVAMKPEMILRVGSITKSYVAAAIMKLVQTKKLTLDDALETWFQGFPNGSAISIRMLQNHTSGIYNYTEDATFEMDLTGDLSKVWTPEELVAFAANQPPYFAPGMGWEYSNTDYILLGLVAEAASGQKLAPLLRSTVFGPAHLEHTFLASDETVHGAVAHGWQSGEDLTEIFPLSSAWSAGAMAATTADTATWARALWGGKVLDAASQAELVDGVATGIPGENYGFATIVMDPTSLATTNALGHNGSIPGYLSWAVYFPETDASFACTVNGTSADSSVLDSLVPTMAEILAAPAN